MMIKTLFRPVLAALIASSILAPTYAPAHAVETLRFGHFWPPVAGVHKNIFQSWANQLKSSTDGELRVQIFPSSTLAKPPEQYEAVKNGIMDVTATIPGYTANRFPLTQIIELPGMQKNAAHGSCIIQNLYNEGLISNEFEDTKLLYIYTHGQGLLHTNEKLIKTPEDFVGMQIRRPTTVVANILQALGAKPIALPAPETYQAMQSGIINGAAFPWEATLAFRLNELANYHTEIGGLYTLTFIVTMNKEKYETLPDHLKTAIDNASGLDWAKRAGAVYDDMDLRGRKQAESKGHQIHVIKNGIENPAWKGTLTTATEQYLAELEGKGLPARQVYARAQELYNTCN